MNKPTNTPGLAVRVKSPRRLQEEIRMLALEELIREDHPVRDVWRYVQSLDLSPLYAKIQAVKGGVGRDAVDPRIRSPQKTDTLGAKGDLGLNLMPLVSKMTGPCLNSFH